MHPFTKHMLKFFADDPELVYIWTSFMALCFLVVALLANR